MHISNSFSEDTTLKCFHQNKCPLPYMCVCVCVCARKTSWSKCHEISDLFFAEHSVKGEKNGGLHPFKQLA